MSTAPLEDEITARVLVPPRAEDIPQELVGHRLALRAHRDSIAAVDGKIEAALERLAARVTLSLAKWAGGIIVSGLVGAVALVWFMATHFAAIDSNTMRIERLEQRSDP